MGHQLCIEPTTRMNGSVALELPPTESDPDDLRVVVGRNLCPFRDRHYLTQEEVAEAACTVGLDWRPATVSEIETGVRVLGLDEIMLLPDALSRAVGVMVGLPELVSPPPLATAEEGGGRNPDPVRLVFAAPAVSDGEDWRERCRRSWVTLAIQHGLDVELTEEGGKGRSNCCGNVLVDGLLYRVHRGHLLRYRTANEDGSLGWTFIPSISVEPVPLEQQPTAPGTALAIRDDA